MVVNKKNKGETHLEGLVMRTTDDPELVKLDAPHTLHMTKEGLETRSSGEVPDLDGVVERPGGKTVTHSLCKKINKQISQS